MTTGNNGDMIRGNGGDATMMSDLNSRRHKRETLQIIRRAVTNGWNIPEAYYEALPKVAAQIATNGTDRDKLRAVEVLRAMNKDNLDAAMALEKLERDDNVQEKTEIVIRHIKRDTLNGNGRY